MRFFSLILIFFVSFIIEIRAQKTNEYAAIDRIALQIPDSMTRSTTGIAAYINSKFTSQADKSRAAFVWIARNVQYDIENMFATDLYESTGQVVEKVLRTRKGVCMHYSELFNDIAQKTGIKSYVVSGYTRQNGSVDHIPHAWCASLIDSIWCLFDPTWGSGYIQNKKFVRQVNNYYFNAKPEQIIKSHMPFDPVWQLMNYPVTSEEFYQGNFSGKNKPFFNFADTIKKIEKQTQIEKLVSSNIRIEKNGVKNSMIQETLLHNKREIAYHKSQIAVDRYNSAINSYNEGISRLNTFIDYRNNQFTPKKTDSEIKQMVDTAEYSFNHAIRQIKEIEDPDSNLATSMVQLDKSIDEAMVNLNEQRAFLNKYFKTGKLFRKSLFYKYTWMGIPLN